MSCSFVARDDDEGNEGGDVFASAVTLSLPQSLVTALGTVLYLLEDTLLALSANIESDTQLTVESLEK